MPHVVLLGDSVFDNGKYVRPDPDDVAAQLRELLPASWQVTRRAVDGATTDAVTEQVVEIPTSATHLVLSVGGNDLLGCAGELLRHPVRESSQAFLLLAKVMDVFEVRYRDVVQRCRTVGLPLLICTIYNGNFADAEFQIMARVAGGGVQ